MRYGIEVLIRRPSVDEMFDVGSQIETAVGKMAEDAGCFLGGEDPCRDLQFYYSTEADADAVLEKIEAMKLKGVEAHCFHTECGDPDCCGEADPTSPMEA